MVLGGGTQRCLPLPRPELSYSCTRRSPEARARPWTVRPPSELLWPVRLCPPVASRPHDLMSGMSAGLYVPAPRPLSAHAPWTPAHGSPPSSPKTRFAVLTNATSGCFDRSRCFRRALSIKPVRGMDFAPEEAPLRFDHEVRMSSLASSPNGRRLSPTPSLPQGWPIGTGYQAFFDTVEIVVNAGLAAPTNADRLSQVEAWGRRFHALEARELYDDLSESNREAVIAVIRMQLARLTGTAASEPLRLVSPDIHRGARARGSTLTRYQGHIGHLGVRLSRISGSVAGQAEEVGAGGMCVCLRASHEQTTASGVNLIPVPRLYLCSGRRGRRPSEHKGRRQPLPLSTRFVRPGKTRGGSLPTIPTPAGLTCPR